jgi:hypothetical protein
VPIIVAATTQSAPLKVFFTLVFAGLITSVVYLFRNRQRFFSYAGDPDDSYASANLRLWMIALVLVHALVLTAVMILEV